MPPSPPRSALTRSLAQVWRSLRTMRTALILLLLLAAASIAGSLIPQWPNTPARVIQYRADHPFWGDLFARLGFFDVFGAWWFVFLTALLFVSLVACLVPRTRGLIRSVRARPVQAREIDGFRHYREVAVAAEPDVAVDAARRVLRRRWYRVARDGSRPALAADKGLGREIGSLLFHWAFILILAGVIFGKGTGFAGSAVVVEGETWVDAAANYDGRIQAGRFFDGDFSGFGLRLRDFESVYDETGMPTDFVSRVDLLDPDGEVVEQTDIRVNHPGGIQGRDIFQVNFGWAPVVEIEDGDDVLFSGPVIMDRIPAPAGVPELAMPWRGFVKLPSGREGVPDRAIDMELWPDSRAFLASEPAPMLNSFAPLIRFAVWEGELTDLSLVDLDTRLMAQTGGGVVGAERTESAGEDLTISFEELRQYSVFQVSRDAGVPLVLLAAILILVGIFPALFTSRRKVWVRVDPGPQGAVVKAGGFALQRGDRFGEEFDGLVTRMAAAAGGEAREPEGTEVGSR